MSAEDISKKVRDKIGEDVDPASIENYLQSKGAFPAPSVSSDSVSLASVGVSAFSNAMERDIESALLSQLDSLGLRLFVDESGRNGQQYFAGEFGRIDLLTTDSNGDFVVIELKREDVPARQLAGLPVTSLLSGRTLPSQKVVQLFGWIIARPSSPEEDGVLEESADAVGILVKWYEVKLVFLEGQLS